MQFRLLKSITIREDDVDSVDPGLANDAVETTYLKLRDRSQGIGKEDWSSYARMMLMTSLWLLQSGLVDHDGKCACSHFSTWFVLRRSILIDGRSIAIQQLI